MTTKTMTLDPKNPPRLSEETKRRYDTTPDEAIDYSETPDLGDMDWSKLEVEGPRVKPTVTMRLDEEVIAYFKEQNPKGYTARMAAVLSAYVRAQQPK